MIRIKYLIFKELNANAGETLMVGDDVRDDVLGAQRVDSEIHKQFYLNSLVGILFVGLSVILFFSCGKIQFHASIRALDLIKAGLRGALVKTGKYQPGDESK